MKTTDKKTWPTQWSRSSRNLGVVTFKWLCFEEAFIYAFMCYFSFFFFFFLKRVNRVQTRYSVDREGLMSEFSEFEVVSRARRSRRGGNVW